MIERSKPVAVSEVAAEPRGEGSGGVAVEIRVAVRLVRFNMILESYDNIFLILVNRTGAEFCNRGLGKFDRHVGPCLLKATFCLIERIVLNSLS